MTFYLRCKKKRIVSEEFNVFIDYIKRDLGDPFM